MEYYYIPNGSPLTDEQQDQLTEDNASQSRRRRPVDPSIPVGTGVGSAAVAAEAAKNATWDDLNRVFGQEFQQIREDPALRERNMQQLIKTYENFVKQTGNKVEQFRDLKGQNRWAAGTLPDGTDVVFWDSTAPHPAVMAHELGHIHMNHANPILDPLAGLQTSGLGRISGENAGTIGAVSAALGALMGRRRADTMISQLQGTALGGALGTLGGSGQFAYELGGATGRAMDYLPPETDKEDAYGDLFRAGMTYGMAGPATAAVGALAGGSAAALAAHPKLRRYAGELFSPI